MDKICKNCKWIRETCVGVEAHSAHQCGFNEGKYKDHPYQISNKIISGTSYGDTYYDGCVEPDFGCIHFEEK